MRLFKNVFLRFHRHKHTARTDKQRTASVCGDFVIDLTMVHLPGEIVDPVAVREREVHIKRADIEGIAEHICVFHMVKPIGILVHKGQRPEHRESGFVCLVRHRVEIGEERRAELGVEPDHLLLLRT